MQNKNQVKYFNIVFTIVYNYQGMLIGALQLQGRHYRESYILGSNQIANYWNTYGVQEGKEKELKIAPSWLACSTPLCRFSVKSIHPKNS